MRHPALPVFIVALAAGWSLSAQASGAMFQASLILHAFGNDVTTGTAYPNDTSFFNAWPLGHDCQDHDRSTPNGVPNTRYCPPPVVQAGFPATGTGSAFRWFPSAGAPFELPQSAFGITASGFLPTNYYASYLQSIT